MTPKDIIENQIPVALQKRPELLAEIGKIIHFDISGDNGGGWTMDLTKSSDWISNGINGSSAMTIYMDGDDFVKLRQGQLNPQMAAMMGKLKFKPFNLDLALKVAKLLG